MILVFSGSLEYRPQSIGAWHSQFGTVTSETRTQSDKLARWIEKVQVNICDRSEDARLEFGTVQQR